MKYVEAPYQYDLSCEEKSLFLAGGITGCPNWQEDMVQMLEETDLVVFNPRRFDFPIDNPDAAKEQIGWEFRYLEECNMRSFWFAKEQIQPIALFELGRWSRHSFQNIFVGVHPDYPRRQDVEIQMKLERPQLEVAYSIDELVAQIKRSLTRIRTFEQIWDTMERLKEKGMKGPSGIDEVLKQLMKNVYQDGYEKGRNDEKLSHGTD